MKRIYYLQSCSTCQRIIDELGGLPDFEFREIKSEGISTEDIQLMISLGATPIKLFSKRALKYRSLGLNNIPLSDEDMLDWMTKEYTFLSRPVIVIDEKIFVGNSKSTIGAVKEYLSI